MMNYWKTIAKDKQLDYKKRLYLTESGCANGTPYEHILSDEDANAGANFYCYKNPKEWVALQIWAKKDKGKNVDFKGLGLKNLLRSEHIPYNFFYPLEKMRQANNSLLNRFLEKLLHNRIHVEKVNRIKIEFASDLHKTKLLNDLTSFDVYIEVLNGAQKIGLGIEVKYTEKSYPWGDTEKKQMAEDSSIYNQLTMSSGYYKENAKLSLNTVKLKQPWRNHLLGIKLVEKESLDQFYYIHLYPKGNSYQQKVCEEYLNCLTVEYKQSFVPITFEWFIEVAEQLFTDTEQQDWISYLKIRY